MIEPINVIYRIFNELYKNIDFDYSFTVQRDRACEIDN